MALMTGVVAVAAILVASCSSTKYIPENQYLLKGVKVKSDSKDLDATALQQYVRQRGNSKWFSLFKIPLGVYAMAGSDTAKWINRTLRNVGEAPVLYDTLQAVLTQTDLLRAMQNMGYMNASVSHEVKVKGKKLKAIYLLHPGEPYIIRNMRYDIQDENIARLFESDSTVMRLKTGDRFTINGLEQERNFLTAYLLDRGYYKFHKEYIRFEADTARGSRLVDLTLQLAKYRARSEAPETEHPVYKVRKVTYASIDSTSTVRIKRSALEGATAVEEGQPYKASDVQRTYNGFSRLDATAKYMSRLRASTMVVMKGLAMTAGSDVLRATPWGIRGHHRPGRLPERGLHRVWRGVENNVSAIYDPVPLQRVETALQRLV